MKKSMKALSLLVVVAFILSLVACAGTNAPAGTTAPADTANPADTIAPDSTSTVEASAPPATANNDMMAPYAEPVTVRMIAETFDDLENQLSAIGESREQNRWTKLVKERLNIDIEYDFVAKEPLYTTKVNVMLATGDLPDIFSVTPLQLKQLLNNDEVADLTDVYDNLICPEFKAVADRDPSIIKVNTVNGRIMSIGSSTSLPYSTTMVLWMRADWLETLNLAEPENMDDLYNIAKAFKEAAPDGEPITGAYAATYWGRINFANAYHAYPWIWVEKNGRLVYGGIQSEMMDSLVALAQWYQEGLIDPEYLTKGDAKVNDEFASGKIGIMPYLDYLPLVITGFNMNKPEADLRAYPMVSADNEPFAPQSLVGYSCNASFVVRKDFEHPDALIKMTNLFTSIIYGSEKDETSPDGTTNSVYYNAPSNASSLYLVTPVRYNLQLDANLYRYLCGEALDSGDTSVVVPADMFIYENMLAYKNGDLTQWGWYKSFCSDGGGAYAVKAYSDANQIMCDAFTGLPTDLISEKMPLIGAKMDESFTKIILGTADAATEFNTAIQNFLDMGGDDITREINEWYRANKDN